MLSIMGDGMGGGYRYGRDEEDIKKHFTKPYYGQ
jgi:hypothetical protein